MFDSRNEAVQATLLERRSVRSYQYEPMPTETLAAILEATRQAPSAANRQPWRFVVIRDEARRQELAEACNGQLWLAEASLLVVGVGLPTVSAKWYRVDMGIALQNLVIAAMGHGYGSCWIGAFNHDRVKEMLGVPEEAEVVAVIGIGKPKTTFPPARERRSFDSVFSDENYNTPLSL